MSRFKDAYNHFQRFGFARLAADDTARAKFPEHTALLSALKKDPNAGSAEDRRALFAAWAAALDPSGKTPSTSPWKYLKWVLKNYETNTHNGKPILAEDFAKIFHQLDYLHRYQGNDKLNKDIKKYKNFSDLSDTLQPLIDKQTAKQLAKQKADEGTTIIYKNDDGTRLLICHTPAAAKLHGLGTKWCITMDGHYFTNYNNRTPIVMLIGPITKNNKGDSVQEKWALVEKKWWNAQDKAHDKLPDHIHKILNNALDNSPQNTDFIKDWLPKTNAQKLAQAKKRIILDFSNLPPDVIRSDFATENDCKKISVENESELTTVMENHIAMKFAGEKFRSDPEFMLCAVTQDGLNLQFGTAEIKKNRMIVLAAVQQNGLSLKYADVTLHADHEIVLAAAKQDEIALLFAEEKLRTDRDFMLTAIRHNIIVICYIDKASEIYNDIALATVQQNCINLRYVSAELKKDCKFLEKITPSIIEQNNPEALDLLYNLYRQLPKNDQRHTAIILRRRIANFRKTDNLFEFSAGTRLDTLPFLWGNPKAIISKNPVEVLGVFNNIFYGYLQKLPINPKP